MKKTVIVPVTSSSSTTGKPHHLSLKTAAYIVTALSLAEKHKMLADRIDDSALDLDDCLDFLVANLKEEELAESNAMASTTSITTNEDGATELPTLKAAAAEEAATAAATKKVGQHATKRVMAEENNRTATGTAACNKKTKENPDATITSTKKSMKSMDSAEVKLAKDVLKKVVKDKSRLLAAFEKVKSRKGSTNILKMEFQKLCYTILKGQVKQYPKLVLNKQMLNDLWISVKQVKDIHLDMKDTEISKHALSEWLEFEISAREFVTEKQKKKSHSRDKRRELVRREHSMTSSGFKLGDMEDSDDDD